VSSRVRRRLRLASACSVLALCALGLGVPAARAVEQAQIGHGHDQDGRTGNGHHVHPGSSTDRTLVSVTNRFGSAPSPAGHGTLAVTVQPVTFSVSDGVPARVRAGNRYTVTVVFLVSRGFGPGRVSLAVHHGSLRCCRTHVAAAGVNRVSCVLQPSQARAGVDLLVTVHLPGAGSATATYHHDRWLHHGRG